MAERATVGARGLSHARLSGLILAFAALWFGVNLIHPVGPAFLLWLPTVAAGAVLTSALLRAGRATALPKPTRQFWQRLGIAAGAAAVGLTGQGYDIWRNPTVPGSHTTPVLIAGAAIAQVFIVYALLRLPLGERRPGEPLRVVLDASTVMLAAAVFLWHFQTRHLPGLLGSLILTVTGMIAVFAVVKVILSGQRTVDRTSLRVLAIAIVVGTLAPSVQPYLQIAHPELFATMVGNPACFFVAVLAADRQVRAGREPSRPAAPRRPFSLLPYAAVAAVQTLLVLVAFGDGPASDLVVVVVAALITVLVAVRQVIALIENGRLVRRLDHSATHDPLTGLGNRVLLQRRLDELEPGGQPVAVVLLDLDGFKRINDTRGHEAGDQLLVTVAQRISDLVREGDIVARLGGDEFVVVMANATSETAESVVSRMITAVTSPIRIGDQSLTVGVSAGIATGHLSDLGHPGDLGDLGRPGSPGHLGAEELQRRADIAMYAAKDLADSGFVHYRDDLAADRSAALH